MNAELLPCPFCGKAPRLCDMGGWEIFCECGADMCLHVETPEPEPLIAAWNTRATQPQAPQGGGWQPMFTAPKDCDVLLYCDAEIWKGSSPFEYIGPGGWDPDQESWMLQMYNDEGKSVLVSPSGWMPLPLAPTETPEAGK